MNLRNIVIGALFALMSPVLAMAQAAPAFPHVGAATAVASGTTAVTAVSAPTNGCYIVNPLTATDQGVMTAEPLYVDPTGASATTSANGSTVALAPGASWSCVPLSTQPVSVNATTSGHKFTVVQW